MTKIFIAHRVKDYGAWKINYDADTDRRASAGFSEGGHYHSAADPNTFMIIWNSELDTGEAQARVSAEFSDSGLLGLMSESEVIVEDPKFRVCADKA